MTEINQNVGTSEEPILQGDDITLDVTVNDDEGNPFNLSGTTITYVVKEYPDSTPEFTKSIGSGITVVDEAAGNFTIEITSSDTDSLYGDYVHRCVVEKGGKETHVFIGDFKVDK